MAFLHQPFNNTDGPSWVPLSEIYVICSPRTQPHAQETLISPLLSAVYSYFLETSTLEYSILEFRGLKKKQNQDPYNAGKLLPTQVIPYLLIDTFLVTTKKDKMVASAVRK